MKGFFVLSFLIFSTSAFANQKSVVGVLPYSNQWVFDERQSFLYLGYNYTALSQDTFVTGNYSSTYGSRALNSLSIDYFLNLFPLNSLEKQSLFSRFSIWSRYSLGAGVKQGQLVHTTFDVSTASKTTYLIVGFGRIGPLLMFEATSWLVPYLGADFTALVFRHSSSLNGADAQGFGIYGGPVLGLHFPLFAEHRFSLYAETRSYFEIKDTSKLFQSAALGFEGGLGMGF